MLDRSMNILLYHALNNFFHLKDVNSCNFFFLGALDKINGLMMIRSFLGFVDYIFVAS